MIKLDDSVDPFSKASLQGAGRKIVADAKAVTGRKKIEYDQFKVGAKRGWGEKKAGARPTPYGPDKKHPYGRGRAVGYNARPVLAAGGAAAVAGGGYAAGKKQFSKAALPRLGDAAKRARRGAHGYKITDVKGPKQQKFTNGVKHKISNARQKQYTAEQWNAAGTAGILGGITAAGAGVAYSDRKKNSAALAKADFAGVKSALKRGFEYAGAKKPKRPEMPGKKLREEVSRGYKAADNSQARVSSGAYTAGAVANKLRTPALAAGSAGAGAGAYKVHASKEDEKLFKSLEPEWQEIEKFRIPSIPNPAVAARGVKTQVGSNTLRTGGLFAKPSVTSKSPAPGIKGTKMGGGLTGAGKAAVGGTAALGAGGLMANRKKSQVGVTKMDAIELYKAQQKEASTGRKVAGTVFGPYHAAVAGKKGRKLGAVGSSVGHGVGGGIAGRVVGGAVGARFGGAQGAAVGGGVGSLGGGTAGYLHSVNSNQAKGRYKKEVGKSDDLSAFGVEHIGKAERSDNFKAAVWNGDLTGKKLGGNGKYNKGERKVARKAMRREQWKGQAQGAGAGAVAGAAVGAGTSVVHGAKTSSHMGIGAARGAKYGARLSGPRAATGGVIGALGGQLAGDWKGRKKGMTRYKKEIGKSDNFSAFGIEH